MDKRVRAFAKGASPKVNMLLNTTRGGTIYQPLRSGRIWHKVNF